MRYVLNDGVNKAFASVNGSIISNNYHANTCYTCDATGATGQPFNFDQLLAKYRNFVVLSSKFKGVFTCLKNADALYACLVSIQLKDGSTNNTTVDEIIGEPRSRFAIWTPRGKGDTVTLKGKFNLKKNVAIQNPYDVNELWGTVSANCTEVWYYHIQMCGLPTDVNQSLNLIGYIDYRVLLYYPIRLVAS